MNRTETVTRRWTSSSVVLLAVIELASLFADGLLVFGISDLISNSDNLVAILWLPFCYVLAATFGALQCAVWLSAPWAKRLVQRAKGLQAVGLILGLLPLVAIGGYNLLSAILASGSALLLGYAAGVYHPARHLLMLHLSAFGQLTHYNSLFWSCRFGAFGLALVAATFSTAAVQFWCLVAAGLTALILSTLLDGVEAEARRWCPEQLSPKPRQQARPLTLAYQSLAELSRSTLLSLAGTIGTAAIVMVVIVAVLAEYPVTSALLPLETLVIGAVIGALLAAAFTGGKYELGLIPYGLLALACSLLCLALRMQPEQFSGLAGSHSPSSGCVPAWSACRRLRTCKNRPKAGRQAEYVP